MGKKACSVPATDEQMTRAVEQWTARGGHRTAGITSPVSAAEMGIPRYQLTAWVKEVATAKMVTANKGKSRLGASVCIKFSQEFASQVSWQEIDERTGAVVEEEDITDGGSESGGGDSGSGGNGNGGNDNPPRELEG